MPINQAFIELVNRMLMNQKEYAEHRGCVPSYINKLVKDGVLLLDEDGKLDPRVCDEILKKNSPPGGDDENDGGEIPAGASSTYSSAATALKTAQTQKIVLELRKEAGELVEKADVEREAFESKRKIRDRLQRIPGDVAGRLVKMNDEKEIQAFLAAQIRQALIEVADDVGTFSEGG